MYKITAQKVDKTIESCNFIQSACLLIFSALGTVASIGYTVLMIIFKINDPFIIAVLSVALIINIVYTISNLIKSSKKYTDIKTTLIKNRIMSKFVRLFISFVNLGMTIMVMTTSAKDNLTMGILVIIAIVIYILAILVQLAYTITRYKFYKDSKHEFGFAKTILLKVKQLFKKKKETRRK